MSLKARINDDMKAAMRGGEKLRLGTIRMLMAAIKQREVDDRREMADADVLQIVEKLIKQRREAATQFASAGRSELEAKETEEAAILAAYLPAALSDAEVRALVEEAVASTGAAGVRDMGKVMNALRPKLQGRADMSQVSGLVKARLGG
ncbi:MAG: aspartyl-tRNA amidotransferase subunit B [Gammaproteobacteria bacterium]|nr:GatB/YqeY domain-containing protein [Gammaproteobacteria bacterium]GIK35164.1 MAG: aspartyl-tRNA amidotransferase subunit B [Gammaproteobacteria bacterium]